MAGKISSTLEKLRTKAIHFFTNGDGSVYSIIAKQTLKRLYSRLVKKDMKQVLTNTKGNNERIVVMSDDMIALCRKYDLRRQIFGGTNPYFFPSSNGGELSSNTIYAAFNKAWGTVPSAKVKQTVRVYDLRHRFASACLIRWLDNGENLNVMLPYLQRYMGHRSINETAYYIHILPENLVKSSAIDWDAFNAMFPEVEKI